MVIPRPHHGLGLHRNQSQITMKRDLLQPPNGDVVQGALPLQSGEASLHGLSLRIKCTPRYGLLPDTESLNQLLVRTVDHDDRFGSVLATDQSEQVFATVAAVSHEMAGMELICRIPGFLQDIGGAWRHQLHAPVSPDKRSYGNAQHGVRVGLVEASVKPLPTSAARRGDCGAAWWSP